MKSVTVLAGFLAFAAEIARATDAHAWLFVEHTEIGRTALAETDDGVGPPLSREERRALDRAWDALRSGGGLGDPASFAPTAAERPSLVDAVKPPPMTLFSTKIDLPMLAAMAGDHACSEEDLEATLKSSWVRPLVAMFARNYDELRQTPLTSLARVSLWHASNLDAQELDDEYLSRAAHNTAHFVTPRKGAGADAERLPGYIDRVSKRDAPMNAVGLYVTYHSLALAAAHDSAHCAVASCDGPTTSRRALLLEAVALHFLEDSFASGHVVGSPVHGSDASRTGTHDEYCTKGTTASTWDGTASYSAFGDAHFQPTDRLMASRAVRASLVQLAKALVGGDVPAGCAASVAVNACTENTLPGAGEDCSAIMQPTLQHVPSPPLEATPDPPFRNEVGIFARFAGSAFGGLGWPTASPSGAGATQTVPTWGLSAGVGIGFSVDGLTTTSSDATGFLQAGLSAVSGQRTEWCLVCATSAEPLESRLGWDFRLRLPYWAIPGDVLVIGPAAAAGNKWAFNRMIDSAQGGLYGGWERVVTLENGMALQLVLGREVELSLYSLSRLVNVTTLPLVSSYAITAPVFDFLLLRRFSDLTSSHLKLTLSYRFEHSGAVSGDFIVLSFASDAHLYVYGF